MAKKRINACWFLLLVLLCGTGLMLSAGRTQARYNNTVTARTTVESQTAGVTSNCLVTSRDPAVTVLVGEMSLVNYTTVDFWLCSSGKDASGALRWGVRDMEDENNEAEAVDPAEYVRITMYSGEDMIEPEMELDLLEDVPLDITMRITPTETARNTVHGEIPIYVQVTWGENMWGTFQVTLPAVEGEEIPADENTESAEEDTKDTQTTGENTAPEDPEDSEDPEAPEVTQDAAEETPEEGSVGTDGSEDGTEEEPETDGETAVPQTTEAETQETGTQETDASEPAEGSVFDSLLALLDQTQDSEQTESGQNPEETTSAAEETTAAAEETTSAAEETTAAAEETTAPEEEQEEYKPANRLELLSKFDSGGMLPVRIYLGDNVTKVQIGMNTLSQNSGEDGESTAPDQIMPLSSHVRFSVDGGKSYYMLTDESVVEFQVDGLTEISLLLDFRYTGMEHGTGFNIVMHAYTGEWLLASCSESTVCRNALSVNGAVYEKSAYQESLQVAAASEETSVKLTAQKGSYVLNQNKVLVLTLPEEWRDAEMEYTVEILTRDEDKSFYYKRIDPQAEGLLVEQIADEQRYQLVLKTGEKLPQAGTYRINMQWSFEDICYLEKQTTFFVNYAAHVGYSLGGSEVSNND